MNSNKPTTAGMTAKRYRFGQLVASGKSQADAYRIAFNKPRASQRTAVETGCRLAKVPCVAALVSSLREKSNAKSLLTLNDRLAILADVAQTKGKSPGYLAAKTRAVDVYSRISGDRAPDRAEVSGPGGSPIPIDVSAAVAIRRLPIRERVTMLTQAKQREQNVPNGEPGPVKSGT